MRIYLGVPIRVVVSPRNLKEYKVEITTRDKSLKTSVDLDEGLQFILDLKEKMLQEWKADVSR